MENKLTAVEVKYIKSIRRLIRNLTPYNIALIKLELDRAIIRESNG